MVSGHTRSMKRTRMEVQRGDRNKGVTGSYKSIARRLDLLAASWSNAQPASSLM